MEDDKNKNEQNIEATGPSEAPVIQDGIEVKPVEHTMEDYFLRYSMSVIVDRATQMSAMV